MKKFLPLVLVSLLSLLGCNSTTDSLSEQSGTDLEAAVTEEAPLLELKTEQDGDFSFVHRTQGENYFVDVLYKDVKVGEFFKELPPFGYEVSVFESNETYAYLAIEPTGLGGYIPFGGPREVARVNLEVPDFQMITTNGIVQDISSDNTRVAIATELTPGISVMVLTSALYPNGSNLSSYPMPEGFDYAGDAHFSESGASLAYVTLHGPDDEKSAIYLVNLDTGEQTQFTTAAGQLKITGWDGEEPTFE